MSDVEDYPGPTKGHEEKMGHEEDLAVTTTPMFPEQEALVESANRVKVLGKVDQISV
jgi:hypothetical protein